MAGDHATADAALTMLTADLHAVAPAFDPGAVTAEIYFCPMHPDFLSANPTAHCDKCGMSLARRDIPYSFVYAPPGEPTLRLSLRSDAPPAPGRACHLVARLTQRDGTPVAGSDLLVTHTQPIHLLIVDPAALEDYHHEHPVPTGTPGEYAFSFVPAKATGYRVFADVVPTATGVQEYPSADLPGMAAPTRRTAAARRKHVRLRGGRAALRPERRRGGWQRPAAGPAGADAAGDGPRVERASPPRAWNR